MEFSTYQENNNIHGIFQKIIQYYKKETLIPEDQKYVGRIYWL